MLTKVVTEYTLIKDALGYSLKYRYSVVDENGEFLQRDMTKHILVADSKLLKELKDVEAYLTSLIPDIETEETLN